MRKIKSKIEMEDQRSQNVTVTIRHTSRGADPDSCLRRPT